MMIKRNINKKSKETKAVRISVENHDTLTEIKVKYKYKSFDEIISIITELYRNGTFDSLEHAKRKLNANNISSVIKYILDECNYSRWRTGV